MTHNESYPLCFGTIYFPTAPLFRNLYLITQMDYLTVTFFELDHLLNTFFPSSDVLLKE